MARPTNGLEFEALVSPPLETNDRPLQPMWYHLPTCTNGWWYVRRYSASTKKILRQTDPCYHGKGSSL